MSQSLLTYEHNKSTNREPYKCLPNLERDWQQAGRQGHYKTERQAGKQAGRQTCRQAQADRQAGRQTG